MTFLTHSMNLTTAWKHQSMLLTPVTTQKETFIAVATKRKTPQNMKGLQAPHRHAASPRTCFFLVSAPMSMLGMRFLPTLGRNRHGSFSLICLACDYFFPHWVKIETHRYDGRNGSLHAAPKHSGSLQRIPWKRSYTLVTRTLNTLISSTLA